MLWLCYLAAELTPLLFPDVHLDAKVTLLGRGRSSAASALARRSGSQSGNILLLLSALESLLAA